MRKDRRRAGKIDRAGWPVAGFSAGMRPVTFRITAALEQLRNGSGPGCGHIAYKHLRRRKAAEGMVARPSSGKGSLAGVQRSDREPSCSARQTGETVSFLYFFAFLPLKKKYVNISLKALHQCTTFAVFSIIGREKVGCNAWCSRVQRGATVVQRKGDFLRCTLHFCKAGEGRLSSWCSGAPVLIFKTISSGI